MAATNNVTGMFFWTDKQGRKRVAYGKATHISPYDAFMAIALSNPRRNSVKKHTHNGKFSAERYALHNQIIDEYFKDKTPYPDDAKNKIAYFTGGGPASGKGTFSHDVKGYYSKDDNPVIIDPDTLKERLIAADGKVMSERNTAYYHTESLMLANRIFEIAAQNNFPVLYDGTATDINTISRKLNLMKSLGYKTEMRYMVTDVNTALDSSLERYRTSGRLITLDRLLMAHEMAQTTAPELFGVVDDMKLYSRSGNNVSLIATGGRGTMNVKDQKTFDNFRKHGAYRLTKDAVNTYMEKYQQIKDERGE